MTDDEKKTGQTSGDELDDDLDDFGFSEEELGDDSAFEPLDTGDLMEDSDGNYSEELLSELEEDAESGGASGEGMSAYAAMAGEKFADVVDFAKENMMYLGIGAVIVIPVLWMLMRPSSPDVEPTVSQEQVLAETTENETKAKIAAATNEASKDSLIASKNTKSETESKASLTDFFNDTGADDKLGKSEEAEAKPDELADSESLDMKTTELNDKVNQKAEALAAVSEQSEETNSKTENENVMVGGRSMAKKVNGIDKRLSDLEASIDNLAKMQKMLTEMNTSLKNSEARASSNDKHITAMQEKVGELTKAVNGVQRSLYRASLREQKTTKPVQLVDYVVQATIAGRAWLRNQDGVLITVQEGQEIPGFGKVSKIDPTKGQVLMSSKVIFREQK